MTTKLVWADDEPDQQEEERDNTVGELKEEASQGDSDFPSLAAAAKMPPPAKAAPKKKKKGQTLSLQELLNMPSEGGGRGGPAAGPLKDDRAILLSLPTSSKGKAEGDEERGGLGGAFKEYGGDRGRFGGRDERRGPRGEGDGEGFQPSRADAVDDWGSTRQFQPSAGRPGGGGFGGGGGSGGFRDREPRGDREREPRPFSQADTADDWGANRKFEPAHDDRDRRGGGGGGGFGGFRDAPRIDGPPRPRAGPMFDARPTRADEEDQWSRGREFQASERPGPRGSSGSREPPSGRQRGFGFAGEGRNPDAEDRWGRAPPQPQAAAAAPDAPAERPRLKLAPRTVPVEQAPAAPAVTSPTADKPAEKPAEEEPPKRRSNPFGEARPREEVLQEKVSSEPPKSAWGKPVVADALAAPAPEEPAPAAAAEAEPAAAPADAAAAREEPAAAPAPTVISLESPAERELKQTIAEAQAELDKLQAEPDADVEDVAEATTQLAALQAKLADMQEERALLEKKAAEAVAEDDGSGWVSAKPAKKAAPAAAAPAEASRPAATSPTGASGGRGGAWGASGTQGGRGRSGGFSDRPSGERPAGERTSGGPPRQAGAGDWPRGGARPVAAGAPGQERKW